MKEKIMTQVGALLPELVEDIKTICNMDSRQDTALTDISFGKRVSDCVFKGLVVAEGLVFVT